MSLSKQSSIKDKIIDKSSAFAGWQSALQEARQQCFAAQGRVRALKKSIKLISANIKAGVPWPGAQSDSRESGQQHSV